MRFVMVELSDRVRTAAETAATGPDVNAMTAACGRYRAAKQASVTTTPVLIVGANLDKSGFHRSLCETKWMTPLIGYCRVSAHTTFVGVGRILLTR